MRTVSCYVYEPLGGDYNCETCGPTCNEVMAGWERDAEGESDEYNRVSDREEEE